MSERIGNIMAVDCCEHTLVALGSVRNARIIPVRSVNQARIVKDKSIDLIVIGLAQFPLRRLFRSELRDVYADVPVLILRQESVKPGDTEDRIRGEFILSDRRHGDDLQIVDRTREILPLSACKHTRRSEHYDLVQEVIRVILESYSNPTLDLNQVAREIGISPKRLSRVLNQEVGMSFRQLLRNTRVEEAKRMLTSGQYSVKEVAARAGFSDSHYFSRSFRELTGQSASEFLSFSPPHN